MKSPIKIALSAAVLASGLALPAAVPASAQVVLQFGEQQPDYGRSGTKLDQKAVRVERRGDRNAARAAANGNYERAAKIDRRTEQRADNLREKSDARSQPEPLVQFRID